MLVATTLHPLKQPQLQYRLHNLFNLRKIIDLRQRNLEFQREIHRLEKEILKFNLKSLRRNEKLQR